MGQTPPGRGPAYKSRLNIPCTILIYIYCINISNDNDEMLQYGTEASPLYLFNFLFEEKNLPVDLLLCLALK